LANNSSNFSVGTYSTVRQPRKAERELLDHSSSTGPNSQRMARGKGQEHKKLEGSHSTRKQMPGTQGSPDRASLARVESVPCARGNLRFPRHGALATSRARLPAPPSTSGGGEAVVAGPIADWSPVPRGAAPLDSSNSSLLVSSLAPPVHHVVIIISHSAALRILPLGFPAVHKTCLVSSV